MSVYKIKGNNDFDLEVVGEASYQKNFEEICGPRKWNGENLRVEAHLVREPDNPYDPNAVRVDIQGKIVGYLPRPSARDYVKIFKGLGIPENTVISVKAVIRGGWKRNREKGHYGIWLDFPTGEKGSSQLKTLVNKVFTPSEDSSSSTLGNGCLGSVFGVITLPFRVLVDLVKSILDPQTRRSTLILVSVLIFVCALCIVAIFLLAVTSPPAQ